jgi:hypothetical protein
MATYVKFSVQHIMVPYSIIGTKARGAPNKYYNDNNSL